MSPALDAILGSRSASQTLLFLEAYGSGHALRIAQTFDVAVTGIRRQLQRLEADGVLLSRTVGRARVFEFNERLPTVRNLRTFLAAELEQMPKEMQQRYFRQRQRPRRAAKPS